MTHDHPPAFIPATPEYVLAVIRDSYRQQCQFDPGTERNVELTFETTIAEWRSVCDLLDWRRLGRALDDEWKLGRPAAAWCALLEPAWKRNLRELCEFISRDALRPLIEPVSTLGTPSCLLAGAFLSIRSLLRDAGADVGPVMPSTPLDAYARHHLRVFLGPIARLAPNALPDVKISISWWEDLAVAGLLLGLLVVLAGSFISPLVTAAGVILAFASWSAHWMIARWELPTKVEFGSLRTFRDLARVVALGSQQVGHPGQSDGSSEGEESGITQG